MPKLCGHIGTVAKAAPRQSCTDMLVVVAMALLCQSHADILDVC